MGYERYPRNSNPQGDYYNRSETQDYGADYGSGREGSYSSARDYAATRDGGRGNDGRSDYGRGDYGRDQGFYGQREYGNAGYNRGQYGSSNQNRGGDYGRSDYGRGDSSRGDWYGGSYGSGGHRFEDVGNRRDWDDDNNPGSTGARDYGRGNDRYDRGRTAQQQQGRGGYGRQPQGYDYEDRGFFARAGDEVRSWFGDDEAERRREFDARQDERNYGGQRGEHRDADYHSWRSGQIAALDRDYDEYRQQNRTKFHNEFGQWRNQRQGQRDLLKNVKEHLDVVGSDGEHVGTVDKVRGDRILLTKNDQDAGGQHHSIPSSWLQTVDDKVTLNKTAAEAKRQWQDEEGNQALFGDNQRGTRDNDTAGSNGGGMLNRSFSGTY